MSVSPELLDFVQAKWQEWSCPLVNRIVFNDGQVAILDHRIFSKEGEFQLGQVPIIRETDISEFTLADDDDFVWCDPHVSIRIGESLSVYAGESANHGSYGFVALCRNPSRYFKWIFFSKDLNPFIELAVSENEEVVATNNNGVVLRIPLSNPRASNIESNGRHGLRRF